MKITETLVEANNEALEKAISGSCDIVDAKGKKTGNKAKGHIYCDVHTLVDHKKHGFSQSTLTSERVLVEAEHALHNNKQVHSTHKVYIISGTEEEKAPVASNKEAELNKLAEELKAKEAELAEKESALEEKEKDLKKRETAIKKQEKEAGEGK